MTGKAELFLAEETVGLKVCGPGQERLATSGVGSGRRGRRRNCRGWMGHGGQAESLAVLLQVAGAVTGFEEERAAARVVTQGD